MGWNLPDDVTDADIDRAAGGYDDYDVEPDIDDTVHCCPNCETPNQFGEICQRCINEGYYE